MISRAIIIVAAVFGVITPVLADYHLERITPVLNQPTFLTQAPGDPPNILYYTTRITSTNSGFTVGNSMGKIWRYDLNTRVATEVLSFTNRVVNGDNGLQGMAFHPDFTNSASPGYGKLYVSTCHYNVANRVEEFTLLEPNGAFKDPVSAFNTARVVLRYNSGTFNHTISWIGFDPNAVDAARHYLYIMTGDGAHGLPYSLRPSQQTNDVRGKFLRVDISGADDYPADTNKNFAIPPSNPFPAYNAANPGSAINGFGEIYITGVRNGYRGSFDRATSDLYWGDVGENAWEEVCFFKADSYAAPRLPVDYGWPQLEGTHTSPITGTANTTNPFTGVISYYPIREYSHSTGFAAIGGYVYRGPIPELQGKYFYSDFVSGHVWMLDFNRNTDPSTFYGTNGTLTEVTILWNQMIMDATSNSYSGDVSLGTLNGLDHIVSFGEDNEGNMYLVDMNYGTSFDSQYRAVAGEIFKLVPGPVRLNWTRTPTVLQFTWSASQFKLQVQTNSASTGFGSTWSDYPGGLNSPVNVTINRTHPTIFFRLKQK